ncbi:MAG: glycoside hydrolase family 25 protein [Clostridia bacterium]|nr:glycoside hydrolase family 25 protein [Clostridia bacterium]
MNMTENPITSAPENAENTEKVSETPLAEPTNTSAEGNFEAPAEKNTDKSKPSPKIPFGLSKKLFAVLCVLLAVIIALGSALAVTLVKLNGTKRHGAVYEMDSELTFSEKGEMVPMWHADIGYGAIPAHEGVAVSTYKEENFRTDSKGLKYYYEDGVLASYTGIDISSYNGYIDFDAVKKFGIDFVIVRLGGRGYGSEGVIYEDDMALYNLKEAKKSGLMVGAYFFSQAITVEEAKEEAEYCLSLLDGFYLDYPLVFDWETIDSAENPRTENISPETLTECARAFCDTVNEAGYIPCLYTDSKKAYMKFDLSKLKGVDIWYAFYNDEPDMYYNYMMWQYSCTGEVDGIEGDVDLNICFKNYK